MSTMSSLLAVLGFLFRVAMFGVQIFYLFQLVGLLESHWSGWVASLPGLLGFPLGIFVNLAVLLLAVWAWVLPAGVWAALSTRCTLWEALNDYMSKWDRKVHD